MGCVGRFGVRRRRCVRRREAAWAAASRLRTPSRFSHLISARATGRWGASAETECVVQCECGVLAPDPSTLVKITRRASLWCGGVLAGVAVTVLFLELALRRLDGPGYVRVRQAELDFFTWLVGAIFVPTLIAAEMLVIDAHRAQSPTLRAGRHGARSAPAEPRGHPRDQRSINVEQLSWNAQAPAGGLGDRARSLADRSCRTDRRDCDQARLPHEIPTTRASGRERPARSAGGQRVCPMGNLRTNHPPTSHWPDYPMPGGRLRAALMLGPTRTGADQQDRPPANSCCPGAQ
jgi:hypothetical protein